MPTNVDPVILKLQADLKDYQRDLGAAQKLTDTKLDAIERRLERVESNPGKDLRKLEQVEPLARRLHALYEREHELSPALRGVQLMLEDFRVSVFAPELGAASRVSASDIESRLALLEDTQA